jgi:hypothetical protein
LLKNGFDVFLGELVQFGSGSILYRVWQVNDCRLKAQHVALRLRRILKRGGNNVDACNAEPVKSREVVQTARRT